MAAITLNNLLLEDFLDVEQIDDNFDIIENEINGNLDNTNVAAGAAIDPSKIGGGGAIVEDDVTEASVAAKIPRLDASGNLFVNGIVFKAGNI